MTIFHKNIFTNCRIMRKQNFKVNEIYKKILPKRYIYDYRVMQSDF